MHRKSLRELLIPHYLPCGRTQLRTLNHSLERKAIPGAKMRKKGFCANRRERPPGGTVGGVGGSLPAGCSWQWSCSELRSLQGPRATGRNKPSLGLPSHLVFIYALTGTCIEIWAWEGHVPHILPPIDSRGANRAAWLVHLLCLSLGRLFAKLAGLSGYHYSLPGPRTAHTALPCSYRVELSSPLV